MTPAVPTQRDDGADQVGQVHGQDIEVPGCMTEETVEAAPVAIVHVAAGENNVRNVTVPVR